MPTCARSTSNYGSNYGRPLATGAAPTHAVVLHFCDAINTVGVVGSASGETRTIAIIIAPGLRAPVRLRDGWRRSDARRFQTLLPTPNEGDL